MNIKRFGIGLSLIVSVHSLSAVMPKDTLETAMTSAHNAAFGVGSLFGQPPSIKSINDWNVVVSEVEAFAKKNITLNSDLTKAMKTLIDANVKIVYAIADSYKLFYAKPDPKNEPMKRNTAAALQYVIDDVLKVENALSAGIKKGHRLSGNQAAAQVLYRLAVSLSTTAEKAQRELRK